MPRRSAKPEAATPAANGETTSGYFRRLFKENSKLLKKGTNQELFDRWLKDHPDQKEVPTKVKYILSNVKSVVRSQRKRHRAEKTAAAPVAVAAVAPASTAVSRKAGSSLGQLEEQIDDCLAIARGMDREGLAEVIELLRNARNAVVRQAGG